MTDTKNNSSSAVFDYLQLKNRYSNENLIQIAKKTAEVTGIFKTFS